MLKDPKGRYAARAVLILLKIEGSDGRDSGATRGVGSIRGTNFRVGSRSLTKPGGAFL